MRYCLLFCFMFTGFVFAEELPIVGSKTTPKLEETKDFNWGSDPFLKYPGLFEDPNPTQEIITLEAVLYNKKDPVAIVNGKAVSENSVISNYRVQKIGSNYVILQKGNTLKQLVLPQVEGPESTEPVFLRSISSEEDEK